MTEASSKNSAPKKAYRAPMLTKYGTVKEMTGNNSGMNTGDAMGMMTSASDRAVKHNIVRVGDHPSGYGLYLFDYKPEYVAFGTGRQFGVMADEVERIVPDAVSIGEHGFRVVDYARLGIVRH